MATHFLDTSALLKLYVQERGTKAMLTLASGLGVSLAVSSMGLLEFRAVLRARQRSQAVGSEMVEASLRHLADTLRREWLRQPLNEASVAAAALFMDRYPLRAPDALQLAACAALGQSQPGMPPQFVCSDQRLLAAARAEGIGCWDPAAGVE